MALLDRPLYGENATGTLARVLSFRKTANPPDQLGDPVVALGTVTKIPVVTCGPSSKQIGQRIIFSSSVSAWHALSQSERSFYNINKPPNLTGFNLFLRLYLSPGWFYFGYCLFGTAVFQLSTSPDQPAPAEYDVNFPGALDEFPLLLDGAHSPQAWILNRVFYAVLSIETYLIEHRVSIEGG